MSATFTVPAEIASAIDVCRDAETGLVIVEADPEIPELWARLHAGMWWAENVFRFLRIAIAALGAVCLAAQAMKWFGA
ncbi:MAG: hypothetical protein P8Y58_04680 [Novosphingobium sp.]